METPLELEWLLEVISSYGVAVWPFSLHRDWPVGRRKLCLMPPNRWCRINDVSRPSSHPLVFPWKQMILEVIWNYEKKIYDNHRELAELPWKCLPWAILLYYIFFFFFLSKHSAAFKLTSSWMTYYFLVHCEYSQCLKCLISHGFYTLIMLQSHSRH